MEPAQRVGQVFFPLDEELALLPGSLTPRQHEHLVHLACWMPFARAAVMLQRLLGIQVSEPTVRRLTEMAGARYEAVQRMQSQEQDQQGEQDGEPRLVVSTDGAYVPLIKGEWAEVRTVAIGEAVQEKAYKGSEETHVRCLSYFSRMTDAATFADLASGEMQRRGVGRAKAVCSMSDGADWIQGFLDLHRPDALRILDFPHAAEHANVLGEALRQAGQALPQEILARSLHVLKHRGPRSLLHILAQLPQEMQQKEGVREQLNYFRKREALMQYPVYQRQGWPIGSGMVESANKVVVQARLKGAGMHWEPAHVNPMLALRTAVCNERWDEAWRQGVMQERARRSHLREQKAAPGLLSLISSSLLLSLRFLPPTPKPTPPLIALPVTPAATLPGSFRPSSHHPWKRGPSCAPNGLAKL